MNSSTSLGTIADMVKNAIRNNHVIPFAETFAETTNGTILVTNQTADALPRAIQVFINRHCLIQSQTPPCYCFLILGTLAGVV